MDEKLSEEKERLANALEFEFANLTYEDKELALTAAQYLVSKGTAIMNSGYFSKARPHIEECYLIRKKFLYGDPLTADTLYILADLYKQSGELKLAESTLKSALEAQVLIFGMLCEQSALCVHSQAEIKRAMGNFFEAETLFTENFARRVEVVGNVGSALLGNALINLSIGKFTEATDMAEKSYTMRMKKHKGMKHVEVLESILCKAKIQIAKGDFETARILSEQALANIRYLTSESNPKVAEALIQIGECLSFLGRYDDAVNKFDTAFSMIKEFLGEINHSSVNLLILKLDTLLYMGNYTESKIIIGQVSDIIGELEKRGDCGLLLPADFDLVLGKYYKAIGDYLNAHKFIKNSLDKYIKIYEFLIGTNRYPPNSKIAAIIIELADIYRLRGYYEDANKYIEDAEGIIRATVGKEHLLYGYYQQCLGDICLNKGQFEEAQKHLRRSHTLLKELLPESHYDLSNALVSLGECNRLQDKFTEADEYYDDAISIRKTALGEGSVSLVEINNNKALLLCYLNATEANKEDVFSSDPNNPCPEFDNSGFSEALNILQQCILTIRYKFGDIIHPVMFNMIGNFGIVKKVEANEKIIFANKLNKNNRNQFKALDEEANSDSNAPTVKFKAIQFITAKKFIEDAILGLSSSLSLNHHWMIKLEKYNIEEVQEDEMVLAMNIIKEGKKYAFLAKYRSAGDKYEIALELLNNILGDDINHPIVASLILSMAENYMQQAKFAESKVLYLRGLAIYLKIYGENSKEVGQAYLGLGKLYMSVSHIELAKQYLEKAYECWESLDKATSKELLLLILKFADIDYMLGNFNSAYKQYSENLEENKDILENDEKAEAFNNYGRVLISLERFKEAESILTQAKSFAELVDGPNHPLVANVNIQLAVLNFEKCNYNTSIALIMSALATATKFFGLRDEIPESKTVEDIVNLTIKESEPEEENEEGAEEEKRVDNFSLFYKIENMKMKQNEDEHVVSDQAKHDRYDSETGEIQEENDGDGDGGEDNTNAEEIDYVFSRPFPDDLFVCEVFLTKAHPFIAEIILLKAKFLLHIASHLSKDINLLLDSGCKMQEKLFGVHSLNFALANMLRAKFEYLNGNLDQALSLYTESSDVVSKALGLYHPIRLEILFDMAEIKLIKSELNDSINLHEEVLDSRLSHSGPKHSKYIDSLASKLKCYFSMGKYKNSKEILLHINQIISEMYPNDTINPIKANYLHLSGQYCNIVGNYDHAISYTEQSLSMYVHLYGDSDRRVSDCLFTLGEIRFFQGKYLESKKLHEQAFTIRKDRLSSHHFEFSRSLNSLGCVYFELGVYSKASSLFLKSFKVYIRSFSETNNLLAATIISNYANVLCTMGCYDDAEKFFTMSNSIVLKLVDRNHPASADSLFNLSQIAMLKANYDKAISGHEEALEIRRAILGQLHKDISKSLNSLGLCLLAKGQYLESRSLLDRSLAMRKKLLGSEHPYVGEALQALGQVEFSLGKLEESLVLFNRALSSRRLSLNSRHPLVAETLCSIASIHNEQSNVSLAYDLLADSLKIRKAVFGEDNLVTAESLFEMSKNLILSGNYTSLQDRQMKEENSLLEAVNDTLKIENNQNSDQGVNNFKDEPTSSESKPKHALKEDIHKMLDIYNNVCTDFSDVEAMSLENLFEKNTATDDSDYNYISTAPIKKSQFPSSRFLLNQVHGIRKKWLHLEHPLTIEVSQVINLNNRLAGDIFKSQEEAESVLFVRRKINGERHPSIINTYVDLAASLRLKNVLYPNKIKDKPDNRAGKKSITRRAGPTLVDQLSSVLDSKWSSSISASLSSEPFLPSPKSKKKLEGKQPIGFMGYAYPDRKPLFDVPEQNKFGKLKVNDPHWLLEAAAALYKEIFGSDESSTLAAIYFEKGELMRARRQADSARKMYEACIDMRRRVLRNGHPSIADALHGLAETYRIENEMKSAEPLYQSALEIKIKECGAEHPTVADTLNSLAMLHFSKGQYATSRVYYTKALDIRTRVLGPKHPLVAQTLNSFSGLMHLEGETTAAEAMYREAIDIKEITLGNKHPDYASALNNLGLLLKSKNNLTEAKSLYEKALKIQEEHYGELHPDIAASLNNLAALYYAEGDLMNSKVLYKKSIEIKQKVLGMDHPSVATVINNLAGLLYTTNEHTESIELFKESLRIRKSVFGDFHPLVAESMNNLSFLLLVIGNYEESQTYYSRSLEILKRCYNDSHPVVLSAIEKRHTALSKILSKDNLNKLPNNKNDRFLILPEIQIT